MTTSINTFNARQVLGNVLNYEPRELLFGTSGRRGRVCDLTQLEIYINVAGELEYLKSLRSQQGGIVAGQEFYLAHDLRPSSTTFVKDQLGRGEIAQAVLSAIADAGMVPINCGPIPTPALAHYALSRYRGSIMVTGSHIPFDRNGYKLNTATGELSKEDEAPIAVFVRRVRERILSQNPEFSLFAANGMFRAGHCDLPPVNGAAALEYRNRYLDFFETGALRGLRLIAYQHSAVGRDLLVELLREMGAEVFPVGRSDEFIPIDTENIDHVRLTTIQHVADSVPGCHAVVSTDGDSDRPLMLAIDPAGKVQFFPGDLLGLVTAEFLNADAIVVPVSCNDAIDRAPLSHRVQPKTRIGSPYVLARMQAALTAGKQRVCGWEANGGFLTGSTMQLNGRVLRALPTRDAVLPLIATLVHTREQGISISELLGKMPRRFGKSGLLKNSPQSTSAKIVRYLTCCDAVITAAEFVKSKVIADGRVLAETHSITTALFEIQARASAYFSPELGFGSVVGINFIDGVRITFSNGDIAHLRPSGNADELRIYAVADRPERAEQIVALATAEPDGILRRLERVAQA